MPIPSAVYQEKHLLPSILSADFSRLGAEVDTVMDAGVRIIHVDVMDGHFVPNITLGPAVLASLAPQVHERGGLFSVHLMIEDPEKYLSAFVKAGADAVSVHAEACPHLYHTLQAIRALGAGAGVAINPGTPVQTLTDVLGIVDFVVVMTVNPGFGGQKMIEPALAKVGQVRSLAPEGVAIEVDGGIHAGNIQQAVAEGADWIVAGSAVYGADDPAVEARKLIDLIGA